jgi:hypothetical protein
MSKPKKTSEQYIKDHVRLTIKRLRKLDKRKSRRTAKKLERCRDQNDYNCSSLACRLCREKRQQAFAKQVVKVFKKQKSVQLITIVPIDGRVDYNGLNAFDLPAFIRRHREKLKRILQDGVILIGGVDVSLNSFKNGEPWWQFHLHIVVADQLSSKVDAKLRKCFPSDQAKAIFNPVFIEVVPIKHVPCIAAYLYKTYFTKRPSFNAVSEKRTKNRKSGKGQQLQAEPDVMLQYALGKYCVSDIIVLIGLKRNRSSDPAILKLRKTKKGE